MIHIAYSVTLDWEAPGIVPPDKILLILINYKFIPSCKHLAWISLPYSFKYLLNCKEREVLRGKVKSRMTVYFTGRILNLSPDSILPQVLSANG
jgi:hypothetical protein